MHPMQNKFSPNKTRQDLFTLYIQKVPGPASAVEKLRTTEREDPGVTPDKES